MTQKILIIHGLDVRSPQYSAPLVQNIENALADIPHEIKSIYFGGIFEQELRQWQAELATSPFATDLQAKQAREWMGQFVGDQYQFANWEKEIISMINEVHDGGPVHLVAHSWGTVFAFETLLSRIQCQSLTLHGAPLDLYRLREGQKRLTFPEHSDNFFHRLDFIGGPLGHCANIEDHLIDDAGPAIDILDDAAVLLIHQAHGSGWHSKKMAQCIANKVRTEALREK